MIMKQFLFTVKQKMIGFVLPTIIISTIVLAIFVNYQATNILSKEHALQMDYIESNAIVAVEQIDGGFSMLDKQLETEMETAVLKFKEIYEEQYAKNNGEVDLESIQSRLGNKYDLILINSDLTIYEATIKEAIQFNFATFDEKLGERMTAVLKGNQVVHEKIRTNVATGLLTKFSYVSGMSNTVIFEISYSNEAFAENVKQLDPIRSLEEIADTNPIVSQIHVFDVYGYQFTNSGEKYMPTEESVAMVERAIRESSFETKEGVIIKRVVYLPEQNQNPLSDHSRIIEITYDTSAYQNVVKRLIYLVFGVGISMIIIVMIVLYLGIDKITRPISELSEMALKVADGDYEVILHHDIEETDEISRLKRTFNLMVKRVKSAYYEIENKLTTTLLSMGDGLIAVNSDDEVEVMNKMAEAMTGWTIQEAYGRPLNDIFKTENKKESTEDIDNYSDDKSLSYEVISNRFGGELPIEKTIAPIIDKKGKTQGHVLVFRDVSDQREKMNRIEYLSYHDQLTGAYNRRYFEVALNALNQVSKFPLSLVMIDVNGLKLVNDALGHSMGDELLKAATLFIQSECRRGDIFARIGGDEFVLLLPNTDEVEAELLMKRIDANSKNILMDKLIFSFSYGIGTKSTFDISIEDIFKIAEDNMYRRKLSESTKMRQQMIELILNNLYEQNEKERTHSQRVSNLCEAFGESLKMTEDEVRELKLTGLMHDIGKIAINPELLERRQSLTVAEKLEFERHPEVGYQMLKTVNEFSRVSEFVLSHHEKWDGTGYPRALSGEEIPAAARIIAIINYFDRVHEEMVQSGTLNLQVLEEKIRAKSGSFFDPELVEIFIRFMKNKIEMSTN